MCVCVCVVYHSQSLIFVIYKMYSMRMSVEFVIFFSIQSNFIVIVCSVISRLFYIINHAFYIQLNTVEVQNIKGKRQRTAPLYSA